MNGTHLNDANIARNITNVKLRNQVNPIVSNRDRIKSKLQTLFRINCEPEIYMTCELQRGFSLKY